MAAAVSINPDDRAQLEALSSHLGHGAGQGFVFVGIAFIIVATFRFVRTGYRLDSAKVYAPGIATELSLSVILAILLIIAVIPLVLPWL